MFNIKRNIGSPYHRRYGNRENHLKTQQFLKWRRKKAREAHGSQAGLMAVKSKSVNNEHKISLLS